MLVIVVTLFAVCWLPLQTYNVLQDVFPYINEYHYINIIWFCCDWLAMSNSCYNPFIYGIYNEKFKREFRQRFPWRSRGWSSSPVTESLELDRSYGAPATARYSLRSSGYDWRRSYSATPAERRSIHRANATSMTKATLLRSATTQRSLPHRQQKLERMADVANGHGKVPTGPATTEMYIFPAAGVLSKKDITSSMEELCSL